jgi:hypothetical protein
MHEARQGRLAVMRLPADVDERRPDGLVLQRSPQLSTQEDRDTDCTTP